MIAAGCLCRHGVLLAALSNGPPDRRLLSQDGDNRVGVIDQDRDVIANLQVSTIKG